MACAISPIYFGGPDLTKNHLRDTLQQHIEAIPSGGKICWMCYYFNEPSLLDTLLAASQRGVHIDLIIDGNPRTPEINQLTIQKLTLQVPPLINIIKVKKKPFWEYLGIHWHPHLHSKLYYFSHPFPHVLIGSYNPTAGLDYLSQEMLEKIGDHSISHNVLVNITDSVSVDTLHKYFSDMQQPWNRRLSRILSSHNQTHNSNQWQLDFLPRLASHPIDTLLKNQDPNATVKCAISHFKGPGILRSLKSAIKIGKNIEIILESNPRRVSKQHLAFLDCHKIKYYQQKISENCLMHNKFILYESEKENCVMFGSFNWSARSRYLNHEITACTNDKKIVAAFKNRWNQMIKVD